MSHNHHHHAHGSVKGKNLFLAILLNTVITVAQVIGGLLSSSLALLSDALHNFSDVLSLLVSYIAAILSQKEASTKKTFGYKRAEIIAAFINAATLVIVAIILSIEAIKRFNEPKEIGSDLVILLASIGIVANGISVLLLKKGANDNLNMKSAYLHLLTDMMASIAVLLGGIAMKLYQIYWIDTALTLVIACYLIYVGYDLLKTATKVLMLFTPDTIEVKKIVEFVNKIEEVSNMHHVHIWQLNDDEIHLEAHIDFKRDIKLSHFHLILERLEDELYHNFGINHVNIQPEYGKCDDKEIIVQD